jgi:hypothetical protein
MRRFLLVVLALTVTTVALAAPAPVLPKRVFPRVALHQSRPAPGVGVAPNAWCQDCCNCKRNCNNHMCKLAPGTDGCKILNTTPADCESGTPDCT